MAHKCNLCNELIRTSQPTILYSFPDKEMGEQVVHEACAERKFNADKAYKKWDFRTKREKRYGNQM